MFVGIFQTDEAEFLKKKDNAISALGGRLFQHILVFLFNYQNNNNNKKPTKFL